MNKNLILSRITIITNVSYCKLNLKKEITVQNERVLDICISQFVFNFVEEEEEVEGE